MIKKEELVFTIKKLSITKLHEVMENPRSCSICGKKIKDKEYLNSVHVEIKIKDFVYEDFNKEKINNIFYYHMGCVDIERLEKSFKRSIKMMEFLNTSLETIKFLKRKRKERNSKYRVIEKG